MAPAPLVTIASCAGVWDQIIDTLAAGHDTAVQMIDTSVVRVHQHGACVADNNHQDMGRSRGGLTSKIHAVGTPTARRAILPSRPVKHTIIGCGRFSSSRCSHKRCCSRSMGEYSAETRSQRPDLLQPVSVSCAKSRRTVIKPCRRAATRYDKLSANYLGSLSSHQSASNQESSVVAKCGNVGPRLPRSFRRKPP
jgi:hypothetical protein